jgi:hypothetical protein
VLRPLYWILRWLVALALLAFCVAALRAAFSAAFLRPPADVPEAGGGLSAGFAALAAAGGFVMRWVIGRKHDPLEFVDTLEHELTHAVVGTLTFAPPVSLTATLRGGGEVELKRSNPLAALAPYCLPLYAFALATLTLVFKDDWAAYGRLAVAFLLGSFAWRLLREFHFGQTDFRAFGFVFSMVFIAAALPLCLLAVGDMANLGPLGDMPWREAGRLFVDQASFLWAKLPGPHPLPPP